MLYSVLNAKDGTSLRAWTPVSFASRAVRQRCLLADSSAAWLPASALCRSRMTRMYGGLNARRILAPWYRQPIMLENWHIDMCLKTTPSLNKLYPSNTSGGYKNIQITCPKIPKIRERENKRSWITQMLILRGVRTRGTLRTIGFVEVLLKLMD